jgi:hypothetical protein
MEATAWPESVTAIDRGVVPGTMVLSSSRGKTAIPSCWERHTSVLLVRTWPSGSHAHPAGANAHTSRNHSEANRTRVRWSARNAWANTSTSRSHVRSTPAKPPDSRWTWEPPNVEVKRNGLVCASAQRVAVVFRVVVIHTTDDATIDRLSKKKFSGFAFRATLHGHFAGNRRNRFSLR